MLLVLSTASYLLLESSKCHSFREASSFTITTNNIKYLRVTLTKGVKDLFDKNVKSLKKLKKTPENGKKNLPCSLIGRTNIIKMTILTKAICGLNAIPIKIPTQLVTELERTIINFIWKNKKSQHSQKNPVQQRNFWRHHHHWHQALSQSYSNENSLVLA